MFQLSEVQKLNTFHLLIGTKQVFQGWTKAGVSSEIDLSNEKPMSFFGNTSSSSPLAQLGAAFLGNEVLGRGGQSAAGGQYAAALNMKRYNLFTNSQPISFHIDTYLFYTGEKSYDDEIVNPLNDLLKYYWPTSDGQDRVGDVCDIAQDFVSTQEEKAANNNSPMIQSMWSWLNSGIETVRTQLGAVYCIKKPTCYNTGTGNEVSFFIGPPGATNVPAVFKARELEWTKLKMELPKAVYTDDKGRPLYDYIKLSMDFTTLRPAANGINGFSAKSLLGFE